MEQSDGDDGAVATGSERVARSRQQTAKADTNDAEPTRRAPSTRKRSRRTLSSRDESEHDDSDRDEKTKDVADVGAKSTASSGRRSTRESAGKKQKQEAQKQEEQKKKEEEDEDEDEDALLASVSRTTRTITSKKKKGGTILPEFASLDALMSNDREEKKKKEARAIKLKRLREEVKSANKSRSKRESSGGSGGGGSPLSKLMSEMEQSMTSLSADSHLFSDELQPIRSHEEKFGFVFLPMAQPLVYSPFKATAAELQSELQLVYRAMQTRTNEELGALLWSKAILLRVLLSGGRARGASHTNTAPARKQRQTATATTTTTTKAKMAATDAMEVEAVEHVVLPARIGAWLFTTMSTHSDNHIVKGCLGNLFVLIAGDKPSDAMKLKSGLPCLSFCHSVQDFRTVVGKILPTIDMEWQPTVYDFLNAFRCFGFQDSKRSMSARSKITTTSKTSSKTKSTNSSSSSATKTAASVPFPTMNMQYVLVFLILSLRKSLLKLDSYDAFSFTMFFLRMQFEKDMHPEIVQLATICIEELLEAFPPAEWRKEWGASLVLRIAGVNEGLFDSAAGWLTVARRLPRTDRGTQLTTGLAIYVLQHRIDRAPDAQPVAAKSSERPLKFPIQSGLVLDIVAGIVEDMTAKYTEKKRQNNDNDIGDTAVDGAADGAAADGGGGGDGGGEVTSTPRPTRLPTPPFGLLCKKVALMDLALQAFLNELTQKEMKVLLGKLDDLTSSHKLMMSAKWHELKTLVSLMHRKYSLENLRVGRKDGKSPPARTTLFPDDDAATALATSATATSATATSATVNKGDTGDDSDPETTALLAKLLT